MRLPLLALVLTLVACGASDPAAPDACVPDESGWGCGVLDGDIVRDSLLTWPDSLDPATGLPWDTIP